MSKRYSITDANDVEYYTEDVFVIVGESDERAIAAAKILSKKTNNISEIVLLQYEPYDIKQIQNLFPQANCRTISVLPEPIAFLEALQQNRDLFLGKKLFVDITSMRVPELFILFKFLKLSTICGSMSIAYSTPLEYEFHKEPFTSYHSYYGNLKTIDLAGFSGMAEDMAYSQMLIFLGFEGVLSDKVNEDITYDTLKLINNLPSLYDKYKDISIINNYNLLASRHEKMLYVPANNPFEVYNFLCENLETDEPACAAPLSTKPIALGVCLYALDHENLRVVYPIAEEYVPHRANSVHKTYIYNIEIAG
jgi:hypothetical protein